MIQGLKIATQGMTLLAHKQDQIANNLANMNTTGFKQSGLFIESFNKYLGDAENRPSVNRDLKADQVFVDYSEGALRTTGNTLDVAIRGTGFFTVMGPSGVAYTRNGNFSLDNQGFLVTQSGHKVLGKNGYIQVDADAGAVTLTPAGDVMQGAENKGTLRIDDFKKPYALLRLGDNLFSAKNADETIPVPSAGFEIQQGYLEGSNVDMIRNMVDMISSYRNYEANQKAVQAQDQTLDRAVNQVGRL